MRICFICGSDSSDCGHREERISKASLDRERSLILAQAEAERAKLDVHSPKNLPNAPRGLKRQIRVLRLSLLE